MVEQLQDQGHPLLTEEEMQHLAEVGQVLKRDEGHTFFREGEETDFALLIKKGHIKVVLGTRPRIVAIRGPRETVGEMAAVRPQPRTASAIAMDTVEVLLLPATAWLKFLYDNPRAMHAQLVAADERVSQATNKVVESDLAVEQKVAKAILELAGKGIGRSTDSGLAMPLSQQDVAALTGASVDSVKKIIRALKEQKMIGTGRQVLYIRRNEALAEIAEGNRTATL
ncbi:Crp/Fnr family transcriptional regulator [Amycolatopsis sp. FBCC-B4732]|uniref:Crp/Fnr family transcriptional regulator n=1 Tax=Amycolatopsis sp. FBCC-B4732 TaxID=3079339 RepID=UPI001FF4D9F2|nr:Crp/Fnr family transcriptional regulator [Amycolatopsis sp. FBCC-B4732]UOX87586.1 Crp/Fnr family transcriptional regulator [Amycolatopsis sp. FBCC-B4732]